MKLSVLMQIRVDTEDSRKVGLSEGGNITKDPKSASHNMALEGQWLTGSSVIGYSEGCSDSGRWPAKKLPRNDLALLGTEERERVLNS